MSPKVPFAAVSSYTGIGILEDKFTTGYYQLLDNYKTEISTIGGDPKSKKTALNRFYLAQAKLITEMKLNVHKSFMIKYE